jgi:hypothetical protein
MLTARLCDNLVHFIMLLANARRHSTGIPTGVRRGVCLFHFILPRAMRMNEEFGYDAPLLLT